MSDLIKRLREKFSGRDRWYVMNADESSYCISFAHQFEAEEWMDKYLRENPGYIERNGYHIVKNRWLTGAEELGSEAADALEAANVRITELETKCRLYEASLDKADAEADGLRKDAELGAYVRRLHGMLGRQTEAFYDNIDAVISAQTERE